MTGEVVSPVTRNPHAGGPFTDDDATIEAMLQDVSVPALAVTPDGLTLACTVVPTPKGGFVAPPPSPAAIELWDVPTGKLRATFEEVPGGGAALAFSPDGRMLASGGPEGVLLWDVGKLLGQKEDK